MLETATVERNNKMNARLVAFTLLLAVFAVNAGAQQTLNSPPGDSSSGVPRFELGVAFSGIHLPDNNNFGLGTRAVFNFNSFFSLEAEGNFFLNDANLGVRSGGRAIQGLFGPKIGFRTDSIGVFVKARPGIISFSNTLKDINFNPTAPSAFSIVTGRLTEPALDLGTVIEFYPSRHWAWRTDLGDTMIFYRSTSFLGFTLPGATENNFQFSTGIHYRF
jgi:hypothetical protein